MSHFNVLAKVFLCVGVLSAVSTVSAQDLPKPTQPLAAAETVSGQRTVSVTIYEKTAEGKIAKTLARPTIKAPSGRSFSVVAGGEIKRTGSTGVLEHGIRLEGNIGELKEALIPIMLKVSIGQPVQLKDPNIKAVQSKSVALLLDLTPSKTKTVQVGEVWCDITIE